MVFLIGFGLWIIGEYVAFSLVAQAIGLDGAIVATLLMSFAGMVLLQRLGASARQALLAQLNARSELASKITWLAPERLGAGLSAAFGALLLVLPGFLSDGVGLYLIARAAFAWHHASAQRGGTDDIIELSPQDYRRIDDTERR